MSLLPATKKSPRARRAADVSVKRLRSAISNGSSLLASVDHRTATMRRLKDLVADYTADLGGSDHVSTGEAALIRRAAMLSLQAERMEARFVEQEGAASPSALDLYQRLTGALRRCLEGLGLDRRPAGDAPPQHRDPTDKIVAAIAAGGSYGARPA
jgi:hypothetical protein